MEGVPMSPTATKSEEKIKQASGKITAVIGPVVLVSFAEDDLPNLYDALTIELAESGKEAAKQLVLEVEQHLGGGVVKTVAMGATDGLTRGQEVKATGAPIQVPVGKGDRPDVFRDRRADR